MAVTVNSDDVQAIATAIAQANRHPDPAWWASRVVAAFNGTEMPELTTPGDTELVAGDSAESPGA